MGMVDITVTISELQEEGGNDYPLISLEISLYSYIYYIFMARRAIPIIAFHGV